MQDLIKNTKGEILIVDDNQVNLDVLRRTLETEGHKISAVKSGNDALKITPRLQPDLIILDIMLPDIDGYEVCRKLKEHKITRNIPIIFMTAKNEVEDIVKGFKTGGVDYITKPFNQEEVCVRVRNHLITQKLFLTREKLIAKLESNNIKLVEVNKLKNKFLCMASHDLRNPLASIRGFSGILMKNNKIVEDKELQQFIGIIHESSQHLLDMVNDLLDYSVIESGNLELKLEKGSIKTLVEKQVKINQLLAQSKNISISVSIDKVSETTYDNRRLGQVLDNLLSNAIKFSNSGTSVMVEVRDLGNNIEVMVKDEGVGISAEEQKKLFQSFPKLSSKPTGGEKSTGLGLAIVKKIIGAHDGFLKVQSEPGIGSRFTFSLPIKN